MIESANWYRNAAELGHSSAQYKLAVLYQSGTGVEKNLVAASKWFMKSAGNGFEKA